MSIARVSGIGGNSGGGRGIGSSSSGQTGGGRDRDRFQFGKDVEGQNQDGQVRRSYWRH